MQEYINKIICGDSLDIMKQLPDNSVDLVLTDPPYGMSFISSFRKETTKHTKIENDDNLEWLDDYIKEMSRVVKKEGHSYIFCSMHYIDTFVQVIKKHLPYKNILIWEKNNTGMGDLEGDYAPKYEFCIYCSNGETKLKGKRDPNIMKWSKTGNDLHPTQKPVEMFVYLINKSTKKDQIVLDCFGGSGTTAVACLETNRNYIVIEKEPKYCAIAEKRVKHTTPPLFTI